MFDWEKNKDYSLFDQKYSKDPFREEFFIFEDLLNDSSETEAEVKPKDSHEHEEKEHFKLNLASPKNPDIQEEKKIEILPEPEEEPERRDYKSVFKNASRQIIATAVILVVSFLALNWSAYYKIAQTYWNEYFGVQTENPLNELVGDPVAPPIKLAVASNPELQKKQIPPLSLEVAPIDNRLIIPRIDQNIPIVRVSSEHLIKRDWDALEKDMQKALQDGVVHYPGTSLPGENGNIVITGHSSYFPWDSGKFKDVFALLHQVVVGDKIVVYYNQHKYVYQVSEIKVVLPNNLDILKQTPEDKLTLVTCTPVGTNLKRLIVIAKPIEPTQIASNKVSR